MTDLNALDDDTFRREVRQWVEANYPAALRYPPRRLHWPQVRDWYMALSAKGWVAPGWPKAHGGMGLDAGKQLIFIEEMERWGVARSPDMGITMIGPLLIRYGTEAQRQRFLPRIVAGQDIWCQGYSEPNAGSDLASLRTEAVADGDHYVVNGQKTWTTLAMDANWMFLLVRTDKTAKKQQGISFLLLDLTSPGVTVRPIYNLEGHDEFAEVFLDNVRVPRENLVGELNQGWTMAKALLGFERIFLGSPKQSAYALGRLTELATALGAMEDPAFVEQLTRVRLDVHDLACAYRGFAEQVKAGKTLGPEVSLLKIVATETFQRITDLMLEIAGEHATLAGQPDVGGQPFQIAGLFLNARPVTIYGGSNEIQRGILAKNVLGL